MNFYLDGWYSTRDGAVDVAMGMPRAIVVESAEGTFGILYIADEPIADWHAAAEWVADGYPFVLR